MLSMTGFGTGRVSDADGEVAVQIACVNHRGCQVQVRGDLRDLALDELVRQEVRTALVRGSITVQVTASVTNDAGFDLQGLAAGWRELAGLAARLGAPTPSLEQVALLGSGGAPRVAVASEARVRAALAQAIAGVLSERQREGEALGRHLRAIAGQLRAAMPALEQASRLRLARLRESMLARLRELLDGAAVIGPEHLVRELAIHSDRLDISEELVRLAAHLDALDLLLDASDEPVGRKLDFLLQEFGREINTIGSKSNDRALTALVLEGKSLIEQLREQAANVA
jgi:uncharacterized protein YicC (UPF0701 family)